MSLLYRKKKRKNMCASVCLCMLWSQLVSAHWYYVASVTKNRYYIDGLHERLHNLSFSVSLFLLSFFGEIQVNLFICRAYLLESQQSNCSAAAVVQWINRELTGQLYGIWCVQRCMRTNFAYRWWLLEVLGHWPTAFVWQHESWWFTEE